MNMTKQVLRVCRITSPSRSMIVVMLLLVHVFLYDLLAATPDERVAGMILWYKDSDVNPLSIPKPCVEKLARAALQVSGADAEIVFRKMTLEFGSFGLTCREAMDAMLKENKTAEDKKRMDDFFTFMYMKYGRADTLLAGKLMAAMPK